MTYEEWLKNIEELKSTNINIEKLNLLKNTELNTNLIPILEPKLTSLVISKFEKSIEKVIQELPNMFSDVNYLDLTLIDFKKEINFIKEIINLKQITQEEQFKLKEKLKTEVENVYDILIREANRSDQTGIYAITINNNKIKWSEY